MANPTVPPGPRQLLILAVLALAPLKIVLDATIMTIALGSARVPAASEPDALPPRGVSVIGPAALDRGVAA